MKLNFNAVREFLKTTLNLTNDVDIPAASENIRKNIPFRGPNVYILIVAIIIASVGLNVNSIPVIIGAMLISPLMGPITGLGLGLGTNDRELVLFSIKNLLIMVGISLLAATLYFMLTPLEIDNPTELLARTRPTIYDVFIALFGGLAGVLETARKEKGTVISGVAIATALMPPLCTVGYGIANLSWQYTIGALFLFSINCIFIAMAAYLMAKFLKFPMKTVEQHRTRYFILSYALVILLAATSIFTGYHVIRENDFTKMANRFVKKNQNIGKTYIYDYQVNIDNKPYMLELRLAGETLNEDTKEMLMRDAENYGIMRSQIVIHEDATVQVDRFNETEIVKNLMAINASNVQVRDDSIKVLNAQITAYKQRELPAKQLAEELQVQLPSITRLTLARGTALEQNVVMSEEQVVVVAHCSEMPSEEEKTRVYEWLKIRLQIDGLEIIFDTETL
ncbi:MAG: TIGR00341 family protein [Paludibacteraceae bacterium]|nr:TIGR00341 family protein [Paludibacteraceae bacterium]